MSRGPVAVVVPTRLSESGIAAVFKPLLPLFPADAVDGFRHSGMFALSNPATLATALAAAGLTVQNDEDVDCRTAFDDVDAAVHAFMVAGPTALAIRHSGEAVVAAAAKAALAPFVGSDGSVAMPAWFRVVLAQGASG